MPITPVLLGVLVAVSFAFSVLNGTIGFGFGILTINLLAVAFGPKTGVVILSLVALPLAIVQVVHRRALRDQAERLRPIVVTSIAGTFVGVPILILLPGWTLALGLGLITGWYALDSLRAQRPDLSTERQRAISPFVGLTAGVATGALGAAGPLLGTYLSAIGLRGAEFAFAMNLVFVGMGVSRATILAVLGQYTPDAIGVSALLLVPALAGQAFGFRIRGRVSAAALQRTVLVVLAIAALNLIASGLESGAAALR